MSRPTDVILKNVELLSMDSIKEYKYIPQKGEGPMPSIPQLKEVVELVKAILFPGFFNESGRTGGTRQYHLGVHLERLFLLLEKQISRGLNFFADQISGEVALDASELAAAFIDRLPEIKRLLCTDVKAVFDGDPAAKSYAEVIFCYPAILSMVHYRIAHELLKLGIPVIPRIITELAHSKTGIDIHPGARIGEYFSIDHGTGVVIGETCEIGNHVRLYQGVTLGARSFTLDERGLPLNVPRHPILEDYVIVYSNSTILGRVTIGRETIIGGNVWLTNSVPPNSRILQQKALTMAFTDGLGI
mgnify:CR=1 FL=1